MQWKYQYSRRRLCQKKKIINEREIFLTLVKDWMSFPPYKSRLYLLWKYFSGIICSNNIWYYPEFNKYAILLEYPMSLYFLSPSLHLKTQNLLSLVGSNLGTLVRLITLQASICKYLWKHWISWMSALTRLFTWPWTGQKTWYNLPHSKETVVTS